MSGLTEARDALAAKHHEATKSCVHTANGFKQCETWANYLAPLVATIIAEQQAKALRDAADEMDAFRLETYSADIFRRPSPTDYAAINSLLQRERGHGTDGIGADCYDRAIKVQATWLRDRADSVEKGAGT